LKRLPQVPGFFSGRQKYCSDFGLEIFPGCSLRYSKAFYFTMPFGKVSITLLDKFARGPADPLPQKEFDKNQSPVDSLRIKSSLDRLVGPVPSG
jgi:hypothetical protein